MKKQVTLAILILLLSCKTTSESINKPVDYSEVIKQAEEIQPELKQSNIKPETKAIIVRTTTSLKECQEYSKKSYDKILEIENRLNELENENTRLKNKNEALEEELKFYRYIKWFLIIGGLTFALHKLGVFQLLFGLIRKAIFPIG